MESVSSTSQVLYVHREPNAGYKSDYNVDFWKEIKKRWMVLGVLMAVALAVLAPRHGAPGGILHTQYLQYLPLTYIYYTAGRSRNYSCRTRLYALSALHTHCVAFALCAVSVNALSSSLDRRVIEGALLASAARPCTWLPLSLRGGVTPALAAVNYSVSIIASPLAHLVLCGRIPLTPLRGVILNAVTALVPFGLGSLFQKTDLDKTNSSKISALIILYVECCTLLWEAEGSLYIIDVMATLFLVMSWLATLATSSYLYAKLGMLTLNEAHALLLVATPRSTHIDWISSTLCVPSGLARLPAVFIAPTQALLLSAITTDDDNDEELPR